MEKEYKNKVYFEFTIRGYEDITCMLGITPSKVYIKGEPMNPRIVIKAEQNGWRIKNPLDEYTSFEEQLEAMLDLLEPKIDILKPLSEKYECEFSLAIFIFNRNESTPWVHLTKRYNDFIRKVEVEFDLDLYCPPDDE
jgi:hypothetical protein